jgi:hypothetical protein
LNWNIYYWSTWHTNETYLSRLAIRASLGPYLLRSLVDWWPSHFVTTWTSFTPSELPEAHSAIVNDRDSLKSVTLLLFPQLMRPYYCSFSEVIVKNHLDILSLFLLVSELNRSSSFIHYFFRIHFDTVLPSTCMPPEVLSPLPDPLISIHTLIFVCATYYTQLNLLHVNRIMWTPSYAVLHVLHIRCVCSLCLIRTRLYLLNILTLTSKDVQSGLYMTTETLKKRIIFAVFFLWRRAPQQKLRTHRSLKVHCATLVMNIKRIMMVFFHFSKKWNTGRMKLTGENRSIRGENLSQCHFVHHKSHIDRTGIEPGPPNFAVSSVRQIQHSGDLCSTYCNIRKLLFCHIPVTLSVWFPQ